MEANVTTTVVVLVLYFHSAVKNNNLQTQKRNGRESTEDATVEEDERGDMERRGVFGTKQASKAADAAHDKCDRKCVEGDDG